MRGPAVAVILMIGLMVYAASCISSSTKTCTVEDELAKCQAPSECCAGTCIQSCTDPSLNASFPYVLRGNLGVVQTHLYTGIDRYCACLGKTVQDEFRLTCEQRSPLGSTRTEVFLDERNTTLLKFEDPYQNRFLRDLVTTIDDRATNEEDELRIAVSLVQHIPYDTVKQEEFLRGEYSPNRLPYQVLYERAGICNEKAKLLAYLLKELGYGVVLLSYGEEKHMAVGIFAPEEYRTPGCGNYTYIESTHPAIISQVIQGMATRPEVIVLAEGRAFDTIEEEYIDAQELDRLLERKNGLTRQEYARAQALARKYDLSILFR